MTTKPKHIVLKPDKDKSVLRLHPWIFSGAVAKRDNDIAEGDTVSVFNDRNEFLAKGFWQNDSIAVKILSFKDEEIDFDFWNARIAAAVAYRKTLGLLSDDATNVFRLINGEGDFMPSLIADFYDGLVVLQFHSVGMFRHKDAICEAIKNSLSGKCRAIFNKSSSTLPNNNSYRAEDKFLFETMDEDCVVLENGNRFLIDYNQGQKTGFFIDQKQNRMLLQRYAANRRVLNAFSYTGGFSVAALSGNAASVTSVDVSKRAIEICERNIALNFATNNHTSVVADVTEYLNTIGKDEFDMIVLDPPAFAKHRRDVKNALKGYRQINRKAIERIAGGGLLFTFSCSQSVSMDDFTTMLFSASALAKRNIRIITRLQAATDHPHSIFHPEGEYLKGYLAYVE
ncbi:MAG: class I SAM-dependent rRNA methyltransferase [Bacteroidales bacterium]|nr:class I SAM-dependent rRNA methyltransferase [Bacteroidales bacterium]